MSDITIHEVPAKLADDFGAAWGMFSSCVHQLAVEKGWWQDEETLFGVAGSLDVPEEPAFETLRAKITKASQLLVTLNTFTRLGLIITEVAEAFEGERKSAESDKIPGFSAIEEELADVVIRVMDLAKRRGYRVAEAMVAKHKMNATRAHKHGGKAV